MRAGSVWSRRLLATIVCLFVAGSLPAAPVQELWLAVSMNAQQPTDVVLFQRGADGKLLVSKEQMTSWGMRIPSEYADSAADAFIPLEALAGLSYRVDEDSQIAQINAPAGLFAGTTVDATSKDYPRVPRPGWGGFLNYDLSDFRSEGSSSLGGLVEANLFGPYGSGVVRYLAQDQQQLTRALRLDTTWTVDRPEVATSFRLGDSITGASGLWGGSVRFGGLQFATNFATRPGLITMPLPGVAGESALPSTVDVYVNNTLRLRSSVPAGPFNISDLPIVSGDGQIRVVVRDVLGREQVLTDSYYASPSLLRAGLHDYSFDVGAIRENYGLDSNDYGRAAFVATDRFGVTDRVTTDVHAEILKGQQTAGFGGAVLLGKFGIFSAAAAGSHTSHGNGDLFTIGLDHSSRPLSFGANAQYASAQFAQIGLVPGVPQARLKTQVYASVGLGLAGSVSASHMRQVLRSGPPIEVSTLRHGVTLGHLGYLTLSISRSRQATQDTTVALSLIRAFGARSSASVSAVSEAGSTSGQLDIQRSLPAGNGVGYRVFADSTAGGNVDGTLQLQNGMGTYELEAGRAAGAAIARVSASGSVALFDGRAFTTRRIDDSFAVVEVGTSPGVRIYRENQLVGSTDAQGVLLVPGLRAYDSNSILAEQADMPLDINFNSLQAQAIPRYRSGVLVKFVAEATRGALLSVLADDGKPIPTGALIEIVGQPEPFPAGFGGEVYVTGLTAENQMVATWPGHRCHFSVNHEPSPDPLPHLGPFTCQREGP
ncbi:MAG: outer rane usher protein [Gammaproteobacteria bacterium]|nr:outer rane usher protein [Gammaproteobacteria bacterium]